MHTLLPLLPRRTSLQSVGNATIPVKRPFSSTQSRSATLIRRPKRPYTFTQLVTLTDGSTFMHRTTSPLPVFKATKDVRNSPMWNPSSQKLLNVEEDEAGKLRAFRERFGRGWDAEKKVTADAEGPAAEDVEGQIQEDVDNLVDLISAYGQQAQDGKPQQDKAAVATDAKVK